DTLIKWSLATASGTTTIARTTGAHNALALSGPVANDDMRFSKPTSTSYDLQVDGYANASAYATHKAANLTELNINAAGGSDKVTFGPLNDTNISTVNLDLGQSMIQDDTGAVTFFPDNAPDTVTINGTSAKETFLVSAVDKDSNNRMTHVRV